MTYFRDSDEVRTVVGGILERFLASADGERVAEHARELPAPTVLELYVTRPDAAFAVDFAARTVGAISPGGSSVRLEIEADVLHDICLERLDPVQISRPFEEDRAAMEGEPEALRALVLVAGLVPRHYRAGLTALGRSDLLDPPEPERGTIWSSAGPPKRVIGRRRPWQRARRETGVGADS